MTREEAKNIKLESWTKAVDIIYDSIGSCDKCEYSEYLGKGYIHCTQLRCSFENDWYCKYYEKETV